MSRALQIINPNRDAVGQYKKSLSNLIISFRHVVGDDLSHGEGQTQDDQDLAVEGRDGGLQCIAEK